MELSGARGHVKGEHVPYRTTLRYPCWGEPRDFSAAIKTRNVIDQDKNVALLQELSSCPATMQASNAAGSYGLFPMRDIQLADARRAYAQS
eukprot:4076710-Pyramimonas_sp.AAC.1